MLSFMVFPGTVSSMISRDTTEVAKVRSDAFASTTNPETDNPRTKQCICAEGARDPSPRPAEWHHEDDKCSKGCVATY